MKQFLGEDFLLTNQKAIDLYSKVKNLPIFDYHCHLSPQEIYENRVFHNITELWLECDHYKWRVMRNAGIDERLITGDADPKEKFLAFAKVLPNFIGNPVYHWAHLELKKYFGIDAPLNERTAETIWYKTLEMMESGNYCARELIDASSVVAVFTTDDPTSDLEFHRKLARDEGRFDVRPSFRPDRAINIEKDDFAEYMTNLSEITGINITNVDNLMTALESRLKFFVDNGCHISDLSFTDFPSGTGNYDIANKAFMTKMSGKALSETEMSEFKYYVIKKLALLFTKYDISMQIHTGVLRNVNSSRFAKLGADCGIDSIANAIDIQAAGILFDDIEMSGFNGEGGLPNTIVYTLNPNSYYPLATMIGDFAGKVPGRMQLGAAWWFMDHRDGIIEQLKIFANTSGLGLFNGMLTDSRSFVSYARHDYFRRILCSVVGEYIENGEYPDDEEAIKLVQRISYFNAENSFGG